MPSAFPKCPFLFQDLSQDTTFIYSSGLLKLPSAVAMSQTSLVIDKLDNLKV